MDNYNSVVLIKVLPPAGGHLVRPHHLTPPSCRHCTGFYGWRSEVPTSSGLMPHYTAVGCIVCRPFLDFLELRGSSDLETPYILLWQETVCFRCKRCIKNEKLIIECCQVSLFGLTVINFDMQNTVILNHTQVFKTLTVYCLVV